MRKKCARQLKCVLAVACVNIDTNRYDIILSVGGFVYFLLLYQNDIYTHKKEMYPLIEINLRKKDPYQTLIETNAVNCN